MDVPRFGTQNNSTMQKSMVVFTFSVLDQKYHFLGKFGPTNQNCHCKLKFGKEKKLQKISLQDLSLVCYRQNIYRSALISRNLACPEKIVVMRLYMNQRSILKSDDKTNIL